MLNSFGVIASSHVNTFVCIRLCAGCAIMYFRVFQFGGTLFKYILGSWLSPHPSSAPQEIHGKSQEIHRKSKEIHKNSQQIHGKSILIKFKCRTNQCWQTGSWRKGFFAELAGCLPKLVKQLLELRPPARNPLNFGPRAPAHLGQQFGEMSGDPSVLPMCSRLHFVVRLQFEI